VSEPGGSRRLQKDERAEDVGLDELPGRVDRAVHVGLGREVDDGVAALHRGLDGGGVGDIAYDELAAILGKALEVLAATGVGELVEDPHRALRIGVEAPSHVGRADEAGAAGDQHPHAASPAAAAVCSRSTRYSARA
jgi:hypothetical protein